MSMEDAGAMSFALLDRMEPDPFRNPQGGSTETLSILPGDEGAKERQESPSGGGAYPTMLTVDRRCLGVRNPLPL